MSKATPVFATANPNVRAAQILIIKFGALGDVVRTAYFAKVLKERFAERGGAQIYWLTARPSVPLLRFNPYIDVISVEPRELAREHFDVVFSLDDEEDILRGTQAYSHSSLVGAYLDAQDRRRYCDLSAPWFDMGLLSVHGKHEADRMKKLNQRTHSEIFSGIFATTQPAPGFFNSTVKESQCDAFCSDVAGAGFRIAINAFAGQRWQSKSLANDQFVRLLDLLRATDVSGTPAHLFLVGSGEDVEQNKRAVSLSGSQERVSVVDTSTDVLDLAALLGRMDAVISSDSLSLHLAVAQQRPTVCFFAPTSAAEIESLPYIAKVVSTHPDYCNYRPDADNSSITADRLVQALRALLKSLPGES